MFNDWWISMGMPFHWIIFQMERVGTRPEKVPLRIFQREQGHFHSFWAYLLATSHDRKSYNVDILWNRQRKKEHTLPWLKTILIYKFFFPSQELSIQHIYTWCEPKLSPRLLSLSCCCRVSRQAKLIKLPCHITRSFMKSMSMLLHNFKLPWLLQEKRRLHLGIAKKWSTLFLKEKRFHYFPGSMFVFFGM